MSMVIPDVGCHDVSHWGHGASVVQRSLEAALQNEGVAGPVPRGVLTDVRKLFKITLKQDTGDTSIDHIKAQLNALMMVWRWFEAVKQNVSKAEVLAGMQSFLSLLELLSSSESVTLNQAQQKTTRQLIVFFKQLVHEANDRPVCAEDDLD